MSILRKKKPEENPALPLNGVHRRTFLKYAGITVGASAILLGCKNDEDPDPQPSQNNGVDLGSGDVGILNYAYALEQLEAAFYTMVVANASFTTIFTTAEQQILTDIRDHEIVHRDFFKAALGTSAIPDLQVDFSSINFASKSSVLTTAKTFEDLGVSAYNGAGKLLSDVNNLLVAGKIVSVEARHAAAIRDLLSANPLNSPDFSGDDVVNMSGLDVARTPSQVLTAADPYIVTQINASNLPTA